MLTALNATHALASRGDAVLDEIDFTSREYITPMFPFPEAIDRISVHQSKKPEGTKLAPNKLPCTGKVVYPATPGQYTKDYYADISFLYNAHKAPGDKPGNAKEGRKEGVLTNREIACKLPNKHRESRREDGSMFCVMGRFGRYILISDYFTDQCGNTYRGFWENAYLLDNFGGKNPMLTSLAEHPGTTSLGRADNLYPNAEMTSMEFEAGGTYEVPRSRFLFFISATPEDLRIVEDAVSKQAGEKGTYVKCKDGSFAVRQTGCKN